MLAIASAALIGAALAFFFRLRWLALVLARLIGLGWALRLWLWLWL